MKLLDSPLPGHTALLASALTLALLTAAPQDAAGQSYNYNMNYSQRIIQHKPAKWHAMRKGLNNLDDTFSEGEEYMTTVFGHQMQAAHEYIDTIYMHKGQTVTLTIPDRNGTTISSNTYQRWYNYRTDGIFRTGNQNRPDLLTPNDLSGNVRAYRLANGYVGAPLTQNNGATDQRNMYSMTFYYPTVDQYNSWKSGLDQSDNQCYVVGVDLSPYRDFYSGYEVGTSSSFMPRSGNPIEPTLGHRVVFYIFDVDNLPDNLRYKALGTTYKTSSSTPDLSDNAKYLYEYEISLPVTRVSNYTSELVTLPLDAAAFKIPGANNNSDGALDITLGSGNYNTAGISLCTNRSGEITNRGSNYSNEATISGNNRAIFFHYPKDGVYGTRTVNEPTDGSDPKATIVVTKTINNTTYNIARYRLTFKEECAPLTYQQILNLQNGNATGTPWQNYTFRVPDYMDGNDELKLLTSLDFDYDEEVSQTLSQGDYARLRSSEYYPFPMAWENSSYGFFDGSTNSGGSTSSSAGSTTEFGGGVGGDFGYYAITSKFERWNVPDGVIAPSSVKANDFYPDIYHMYVDASQYPGVLARLPFEDKLCQGSELRVTAWVRSASVDNDNAGILFTVLGVRTHDEDGKELQEPIYEPIYRHYSGQIPNTLSLNSNIPGCGNGNDQWWQLYFTFVNDVDRDFDSYMLQLDNYCASSSGGDFDLDNIRVYIAQPSAAVEQLETTCTGDATPMNISLDWDRLAPSLGIEVDGSGTDVTDYIDFCFLDITAYNRYVQNYLSQNPGSTQADAEAAARKADVFAGFLVPIFGQNPNGDNPGDGTTGTGWTIGTLAFHTDFGSNPEYNRDNDSQRWAFAEGATAGDGVLYQTGSEATDDWAVTADLYTTLTPNYPYQLLIRPRVGSQSTAEDFAIEYGSDCAIRTDFRVTSSTLLKVNGEVVQPDVTYCAGNVFNFTANVRLPYVDDNQEDQFVTIAQGVYFDWFFGTDVEYKETFEAYGGLSLQDALRLFRNVYPEMETEEFYSLFDADGNFIEGNEPDDDLKNSCLLIKHFLEEVPVSGGLNRRLVLRAENLNITLLESGLYLIVQPIQTQTAPDNLVDENGNPITGITPEQWLQICWNYIPLFLEPTDAAPELHAGFNSVIYPDTGEGDDSDFNPNLRIGRKQIEDVAAATGDDGYLRIDLRGMKVSDPDEQIDHMGIATLYENGESKELNHIYLTGTNDPAYLPYLNASSFTTDALPIGTIHHLYASASGASDLDYMLIDFELDAQTVYGGTQEEDQNFKFNPKEGYYYTFVVHFEEYSRAGSTEGMGNSCLGSFPVTMYVVPEYLVWQGGATDNWNNDHNWRRADGEDWNAGEDKQYLSNADNYADDLQGTEASAYVPMLFSKVIMPANSSVELYPGGYLNGSNWVAERPDYIGLPTDNIQYDLMVYERTGDEESTLQQRFSTQRYRIALCDQIHFEPGARMINSQYMLYNKAWVDVKLPARDWTNVSVPLEDVVAGDWYTQATGSDAELEYFSDLVKPEGNPDVYQRSWSTGATIVENGNTQTNVSYGEAVWSAAYNDASVPYTAGAGFSIRAREGSARDDGLLFRLPKSETSYTVSTEAIDRTDAGRLTASQLVERNTDYSSAVENPYFRVTLQPSKDGKYFIVGNPFVADMDVQRFLEANIDVLEQKYWLEADNGDPMTGVWSESSANWETVDGTGSPVYVEPFRAFFVERKAVDTGKGALTVKFTKAMQNPNEQVAEEGTATTQGLSIEARGSEGRSTALVSFSGRADDGYAEGEDVQLVDFGSGATVPMVYSVAGQKAAAINRLSAAQQIPLGVYAPGEDEAVTLTFRGVGNLAEASLYDAETRTETPTETPLTEGYELTVTGSSHGRYFLRAAGDFTSLDELPQDAATGVSVYSVLPGELIVAAAGQRLESVAVYDASGAQVFSSGALAQEVCKAEGLQAGTYVVVVQAGGRTESYKIALQ